MAITYVNALVNLSVASNTNSFSFDATGSDILFLGVFSTAGDTCTGVTYNGVSMTLIDKQVPRGSEENYLFYLLAPTTGSNTLTISFSGSTISRAHASCYLGSKQSGVPDATNKGTYVSAGGATANLTTVANNCWTVLMVRGGGSIVAGTGSTERPSTVSDSSAFFDSNGAITPAGSHDMVFTDNNPSNGGWIMASFAPVAAPNPNTPSVADSSAISDTSTINVLSYVNKTDSTAINDTVTIFVPTLTLSVTDSTQVKEILTMGSVIVFDNTANFSSLITSVSGSFTTAGTNRALIAFVYSASGVFDISNPTYNGVVMSNADVIQLPAGSTGFLAAYYLSNPASGSNTFSVSRTGTGTYFAVTLASYYNVQQDGSPDATSTATVLLSNTITATVAANFANDWTVMGVVSGLASTLSAGSNSFARTNTTPLWLFDSNASRGAIGSYSMTVTSAAPTDGMAAVILSIDPYIFFETQPYLTEGDNVFVFDTPTITVSAPQVVVSDSSAVSDTVSIQEALQISVSDSSAIGESVALSVANYIAVTDSSIVTDTPTINLRGNVSVTDSTAVSDSPTVLITTLFLSVGDSTAIGESVALEDIEQGINISDSTAIGESVTLTLTIGVKGYSFAVFID